MDENIQLPGCRLHIINTEKFKNTVVSVKFKNKLTRDTSTVRSLLSMVLLGGTKDLPSMKELAVYLEEMYGASLSTNVSTKGKAQIIHLTSSFVNEKYLVEKEGLFAKQLSLMKDVLFSPFYINGTFSDQVVEMKKRELRERLFALKDDKYTYALDKTLDLMGKGQELGISGIGYEEDIEAITNQDLSAALASMIANDTIEIYAVGDFGDKETALLKNAFPFAPRVSDYQAAYAFKSPRNELQKAVEIQNLTQSKFNMAFKTDTDFLSENHEAMTIFNGVFGAFSHSRLFKNVREKHSLCYYIGSNYDAFNGVLVVSCGIEAAQAEQVEKLVMEQLEDLKQGHISDEEIAITKMMFENSLRKSQDEPGNIIMLKYNRDIVNKEEKIEQYLEKLLAVSKEDIIRAAGMLTLDTTFLLKGERTDGND